MNFFKGWKLDLIQVTLIEIFLDCNAYNFGVKIQIMTFLWPEGLTS